MPKPIDPVFSTAQNSALAALGAIGSGNTWGAFDVTIAGARLGHAARYVVPLWNYHRFGADGVPDPASKGVVQVPMDATMWYLFRRPPAHASSQWKAQWASLELCQQKSVPIIGVLKDRVSRLCALSLTFDCGPFMDGETGDDLWMEVRPRTGVDPAVLARYIKAAPGLPPLAQLDHESAALEQGGYFDPTNLVDARARTLREVVQRRGQSAFRRALVAAYGGRCAVTGCDAEDALEAAHIIGYLGPATNHVTNGLLLRADIHTLFDMGLVAICPDTLRVALAPSLRASSYSVLEGQTVALPAVPAHRPNRESLRTRWSAASV
jgi:hypothetical protein